MIGERLYGFEGEGARVILNNGRGKALAAIVVIDPELEVLEVRGLKDRFFAIATVRRKGERPLTLVSAYFKYSVPVTEFIGSQKVLQGMDVFLLHYTDSVSYRRQHVYSAAIT